MHLPFQPFLSTSLPVLRLAQPPRFAVLVGRIVFVFFLAFLAVLFLAPWQQTASGTGRVIAYAPLDRQQKLEAPIPGRITRWYVTEGDKLKKDDLLAEIGDNDPDLLLRMRQQRSAIFERLKNAEARLLSYQSKVKALEQARSLSLQAAQLKVKVARQKIYAAEQKLASAQASLLTARLNLQRLRALKKDQLISSRNLELAELSVAQREADVNTGKTDITAAKAAELATQAEVFKIGAEAQAKVDTAEADLQKTREEIAKTRESIAKTEISIARQKTQVVRAPRDCTVLRLLVGQNAEMLKAGTPIALIVPLSSSHAVELWIDGNDAPLVQQTAHVRLQFEGWPAIQFMGWPSVAVGTFGGKVVLVDATDDGKGKFRVLVVPEISPSSERWPDQRYLRQGVRTKGWIFLSQVSIAYELWRVFNGFPPSVDPQKPAKVLKKK